LHKIKIAETSITLEGIKFVVDTGKYKVRFYSGATGMESLTVSNITKAQARQRSGRAGRTSAGQCFRLYTESGFQQLHEAPTPEILRVNLAHVVLQLKGMGIRDPRTFDFLSPPDTQTLVKAFELLYALGAMDSKMNISQHGKDMAKFPLDPTFAHLLLQSNKYHCVQDMLTTVAMLSVENVLHRPGGHTHARDQNLAARATAAHRRFLSYEGDIPTLLFIYNTWTKEALYKPSSTRKPPIHHRDTAKIPHAEWSRRNFINARSLAKAFDIRWQISEICSRNEAKNGLGWDLASSSGSDDAINFLKCVSAGLFMQSCSRIRPNSETLGKRKRQPGSFRGYRTKIGCKEVSIHPNSSLFARNPPPKCVVYTELLFTKKTYIRGVTQVKEEWLAEVAPSLFK